MLSRPDPTRLGVVSERSFDILWSDQQIDISKDGHGATKTAASNGYVPMHPVMAQYSRSRARRAPEIDDSVSACGNICVRLQSALESDLQKDNASVFTTCDTALALGW
jgi:hypothetical protein